MSPRPNKILQQYQKLAKLPGGKRLFSAVVCRKAPYFSTASPQLLELRANYCQAKLKKRRAVENHIGTVHVIAVCNVLEFAMGVLAEASIPSHLRWIPKGMDVRYTAKADSDLVIEAVVDDGAWDNGPELQVKVNAKRADGTVVVEGVIHLWVTEKPAKHTA
ncbi:hotdog fold domain-containing protein [Isoalcanivorax beigongshangi]|uniref:Hotdog fold domain-containing protein n=1 Tax=Isoalcanivorax beigongshangi TaxID=3238810 RepID=A0ABV4AFC1_9GAMM